MDRNTAIDDLQFIRGVLERTERRIDPHAFHYVLWGLIVFVWYPLAHWFQMQANLTAMLYLGVGSVALGSFLSGFLEWRRSRKAPLERENTFVSRQVGKVTAGALTAAIVVSAVGPATGMVPGEKIPVVWGIAYAVMAYNVGVVYRSEFLWAGVAIFAGSLAALALPEAQGYILGPVMGLGMLIPGVMAEMRVRRMRVSDGAAATGAAAV
jgi:hypothetical protein